MRVSYAGSDAVADPSGPRPPDEVEGARGRDVSDVQVGAGQGGEFAVPRHDDLLGSAGPPS